MNHYTDTPFSDPRMERWFSKIDESFVGAPPNNTITDPAHIRFSAPSTQYILYDRAPQLLIRYSELKFIEAECNWRLGNASKSNEAYEIAVREALTEREIPESQIAFFVNESSVLPGAENLTLQHIMEQKWISFWLFQSIEAYSDVRRTGYPEMKSGRFPLRIPYPDSERSRNPHAPPQHQYNLYNSGLVGATIDSYI